jgi:hypothetical protein
MALGVNIVSSFDSKGINKAIADFKKLDGAGNKAAYSLKSFDKALGNGVIKLAKFGAVAAIAGAVIGKAFISSASNLQESISKINAVFGQSSTTIIAWSETTAKALGISQQKALEAAGTYGNLFQAFGIGAPEAQKMSVRLVELAADMASFNNVPIDDALLALRSGLSGETEPLKKFGVALNEAALKNKALEMGLISTTKGTLPQAIKTQAAYALILEQTSIQQGDVARTSDGVAFKMKSFGAQVEDVKARIGTALIPIFSALMSFLNDKVIPVFVEFSEILGDKGAGSAFKYLGTQILKAIGSMGLFGNTVLIVVGAIFALRAAVIAYNVTLAILNVLNALAKAGFLGTTVGVYALNAAMYANPIGLIVAGFVLLVAVIALLIIRFKAVRDAIANAFGWFGKLFGAFKKTEEGADDAAGGINRVNAAFEGLTKKQLNTFDTNRKFFRDGETGAAAMRLKLLTVKDTFTGVSDSTGKATDKLQEFIDKIQGVTKAQRSLKDANNSVNDSNNKLKDTFAATAKAQANFNKITKGYALDSKEVVTQSRAVADAQRNLNKANISAADSVKSLQDAEQALKELRAGPKAFDLESGEISLQKAKFDVEEANFAVLEAEQELADLRKDPKTTPQKIREAEIALAESKFDVRDAIESVADAEDKLHRLRTDTPTLKEIAAAERLVADGKLAVEDANIAVADAQTTVNEEQEKLNGLVNGAKEGTDEYTQALKELTDAQKAESDAIRDRVDAYEKLADATRDLAKAEKERSDAKKGLTPAEVAKGEAGEAASVNAGLVPELRAPTPAPAVPKTGGLFGSFMEAVRNLHPNAPSLKSKTPVVDSRSAFPKLYAQYKAAGLAMAKGGIVTSPTQILAGEAGAEAIIPLDKLQSGMTVNVTINAGIGTDASAVGDEIVNVLQRYNRRNGALPLKVA